MLYEDDSLIKVKHKGTIWRHIKTALNSTFGSVAACEKKTIHLDMD